MRIGVLGELEVTGPSGDRARLAPRQRHLMLALLVHLNRVVSTERLIDALWETNPPKAGPHAVQTAVFRLRSELGRIDDAPDRLSTSSNGYALSVHREHVDAFEFEDRLGRVRHDLLAAPDRSAAELRSILELWRGDPFLDAAYLGFAQGEIRRLDELRLLALQSLMAAEVAAGHGEAVIGELDQLTLEHPLREPFWALLFTALNDAGRRTEVPRWYERARAVLRDEYDVAPSTRLDRLATDLAQAEVNGLALAVSRGITII